MNIHAELKKDGRSVAFDVPCNDYGIDIALQNLGETDITETKQLCLKISGDIPELAVLQEQRIDVDELNFLAKYLDSFIDEQIRQFQAAMLVTGPTQLKDMINLAFNLHNYTLITDFSDIAEVGKTHLLNVEMAVPADSRDFYNYAELGQSLITSGKGTITPYGVLFVNDIPMQEVYNGETFPEYLYEDCVFGVTIGYRDKSEYLYLPCAESAIDRAVHRLGASEIIDCTIQRIERERFPIDVLESIRSDIEITDIRDINKLSAMMTDMKIDEIPKFSAVCDFAGVCSFSDAAEIAGSLDSFEFAEGALDEEDLGKYLIQESGRYAYDEALDDYYNYEALGADTVSNQGGRFTEYGYVGIKDGLDLSEIIDNDENMEMGGM